MGTHLHSYSVAEDALKIDLPYDPAIPLLWYSKELK
jgi:hypothetical protein